MFEPPQGEGTFGSGYRPLLARFPRRSSCAISDEDDGSAT